MRQWQADEIRAVIEMLATAQEDGYRTAEGRGADPFNDGFPYVCGVLQARLILLRSAQKSSFQSQNQQTSRNWSFG